MSPFNLAAVATFPTVIIEDRCDLKKWVVVLLDHLCAGIAVRAPGGTNNGDLLQNLFSFICF